MRARERERDERESEESSQSDNHRKKGCQESEKRERSRQRLEVKSTVNLLFQRPADLMILAVIIIIRSGSSTLRLTSPHG